MQYEECDMFTRMHARASSTIQVFGMRKYSYVLVVGTDEQEEESNEKYHPDLAVDPTADLTSRSYQ